MSFKNHANKFPSKLNSIFTFTDHFIRVKFKFEKVESFDDNNQKQQDKLGEKLYEKLGENRQKILQLIKNNPDITIQELSRELGISTTAIEKNIKLLKQKGYIKRIGSDKGGSWVIIN